MSAKLINATDNVNYVCNICTDIIIDNKIIGLSCNPEKHIFCYDCILDWYLQLNKKKKCGNYPISNMCPICRNHGGLLPILENYTPIKNIHNLKDKKFKKEKIINPNKLPHECGVKLKTKEGYCILPGKYDGFCGKHQY